MTQSEHTMSINLTPPSRQNVLVNVGSFLSIVFIALIMWALVAQSWTEKSGVDGFGITAGAISFTAFILALHFRDTLSAFWKWVCVVFHGTVITFFLVAGEVEGDGLGLWFEGFQDFLPYSWMVLIGMTGLLMVLFSHDKQSSTQ